MLRKEAALVLVFTLQSCLCRPQNTREILLTPLNVVRNTGNTVLNTGTGLVNAVPSTIDSFSNTAVNTINAVPTGVNTVTDFTVDSINAVPSTVNNLAGFGFAAPANAIRLGSNTLRTLPSTANTAFTTFARVPGSAVRFSSSALQSGTNAVLRTPGTFTNLANGAVVSGSNFVRGAPNGLSNLAAGGTRFVARAPAGVFGLGQEAFGAGATGVNTIATDGINLIGAVPSMAGQLVNTGVRTGGAVLNGGARMIFATGDSLARTGLNTLNGGARVILATAGSGMQMASRAVDTFRQLF